MALLHFYSILERTNPGLLPKYVHKNETVAWKHSEGQAVLSVVVDPNLNVLLFLQMKVLQKNS